MLICAPVNQNKAARFYRKYNRLLLNQGMPWLISGLALANGQLGLLDQSIAQANKALSLMPNDTQALNILGLGLIGKGRLEEAIASLEKSLKLNPENISTKEYLALARQKAKI